MQSVELITKECGLEFAGGFLLLLHKRMCLCPCRTIIRFLRLFLCLRSPGICYLLPLLCLRGLLLGLLRRCVTLARS